MNAVADQDQDMGDGMQCSDHPYRSNPGGICAFCLQEKLGKLVSSASPLPIHASATSSSSSPPFRSDIINGGNGAAAGPSNLSVHPTSSSSAKPRSIGSNSRHDDEFYNTRRARISFLLAKKKKKVSNGAATTGNGGATVASSDREAANMVFNRSKSTTTPRRGHHFLDGSEDFSPRKRGGFWSFLYHSSTKNSSHALNKKAMEKSSFRDNSNSKISSSSSFTSAQKDSKCLGSSSLRNKSGHLAVDADDDSNSSQATAASASSFERKVSRSRSVGCGSRSFSGDFFERISTGFGDCTLRRVESQREGKPKAVHRGGEHNHHNNHCMKEKVKCGGIFSGFMMTSSSSSSSSSSYWVSSSAEGPLVHVRSRSWGWAFASPMRAFSKPSSKDGKREIIRQASDKNTAPNLNAIPSLLSVRSRLSSSA
ncbi:hypothetical protein ACFX13_022224 [Malus domestica]